MKRFSLLIFLLSIALLAATASVSSAHFIFMQSNLAKAVSGSGFASWNEETEGGWTGSGTSNFIVIFEAAGAGDNETGQGHGVVGADAVLTQFNNVPAAAGDPVYRQITQGSSQRFEIDPDCENVLFGAQEWLVLLKVSDLATSGNGLLLGWNNTGAITGLAFRREGAAQKLEVVAPGLAATKTTDAVGAGDDEVYIVVWRKTGQNTRAAFSVGTKPTAWADFDANKRMEGASGTYFDINCGALGAGLIGRRSGAEYVTAKLHYLIISTDPDAFISD